MICENVHPCRQPDGNNYSTIFTPVNDTDDQPPANRQKKSLMLLILFSVLSWIFYEMYKTYITVDNFRIRLQN